MEIFSYWAREILSTWLGIGGRLHEDHIDAVRGGVFSGSHSSLINRHREQARSYSGLSTYAKSGRLLGRHRGRALLPQWVEYIREIRSPVRAPSRASLAPTVGRVHSRNQVVCQAVIAGKPAPTLDLVHQWDQFASQPPIIKTPPTTRRSPSPLKAER